MVLRSRRVWGVLGAIAMELAVALAAGMTGPVPSGSDGPRVRGAVAAGLYFDYLVTIVMENKDLCDVLTYCGGFSPYLTNLADTWGIADEARYCNVNPSLPTYLWFTPNDCNNMHSCRESIGDTYMSVLVPKILNSTVFRTTRAALFITFDEGYRFPTYAVWVGPLVKTAYASSYGYTHYSVLATIESNWNLSPLTANDRDAPHMGEFFVGQPSRGFQNPPPHPLPLAYVATISGSGGVALIVTGA